MKYVIARVIDGNGEGSYFAGVLTGAPSFSELEHAQRFDTRAAAESHFTTEAIENLGLSVEEVAE